MPAYRKRQAHSLSEILEGRTPTLLLAAFADGSPPKAEGGTYPAPEFGHFDWVEFPELGDGGATLCGAVRVWSHRRLDSPRRVLLGKASPHQGEGCSLREPAGRIPPAR